MWLLLAVTQLNNKQKSLLVPMRPGCQAASPTCCLNSLQTLSKSLSEANFLLNNIHQVGHNLPLTINIQTVNMSPLPPLSTAPITKPSESTDPTCLSQNLVYLTQCTKWHHGTCGSFLASSTNSRSFPKDLVGMLSSCPKLKAQLTNFCKVYRPLCIAKCIRFK